VSDARRQKSEKCKGSRITTRHLSEVAEQYLDCLAQKVDKNPQKVLDLWPSLLGYPRAAMTKALKFESGVLHVSVQNSTLLSLLNTPLEKKRLLKMLRQQVPEVEIVDIAFSFG